ncbi:hypothetical protein HO173_007933 [Letharia columbiana]|uniref:Catalase core domain-containing protein n=1 Tax=Letharia columbiana TaxID=112416 RepID=A0A8H6FS64_9LECA|nr:uncharacterized protein HO173_007933 [Letharia columbiana]KAF6233721.1 hypothetical protein HO173_007933 [Letharia columbiana]
MVANDKPAGTLRYEEKPVYTTSNGCPVNDPESSQRVGQNGPLLLQDFHLIDLLAHFDRERIPERVVHAKGAGAYGEFEVTHDISDLTSLDMLNDVGKRPNASLAFRPLVEKRVRLTRHEILGASLSSSIPRRVTGTGFSTIPPFSSYVIPRNFPFSSIPKSEIHRRI